jgi:cell wall-associated NlpC family hydrolase
MPSSLRAPPTKLTDCSGYATLSYKDAGAPNPNRSDGVYDGYGYTGTLASCSRKVSSPKAGDFAFYGSGTFSHVAICDGKGGVYSFGSDPIKHYSTAAYRSDFAGYWRSNHFSD